MEDSVVFWIQNSKIFYDRISFPLFLKQVTFLKKPQSKMNFFPKEKDVFIVYIDQRCTFEYTSQATLCGSSLNCTANLQLLKPQT